MAAQSTAILSRTLLPRTPGGVRIPLFLPRVTTRGEPDGLMGLAVTSAEVVGVEQSLLVGVESSRSGKGDHRLLGDRVGVEREAVAAAKSDTGRCFPAVGSMTTAAASVRSPSVSSNSTFAC